MAGRGFKKSHAHGETDEFGYKAVIDEVKHYDYHATLPKLFGLAHTTLT